MTLHQSHPFHNFLQGESNMLQYFYTYIMAHMPRSEKGQDLSEYGLLVALIAIIVLLAVTVFGSNLSGFFSGLAARVATWGS